LLLTVNQASENDVARALPAVARLDDVVGRFKRLEERCAEASSDCRSLSEEVADAGANLAAAAREFAEQRGPVVSETERKLLSAVVEMVFVAMSAAGVEIPPFLLEEAGDGELQVAEKFRRAAQAEDAGGSAKLDELQSEAEFGDPWKPGPAMPEYCRRWFRSRELVGPTWANQRAPGGNE
jgi:hypothetical protein